MGEEAETEVEAAAEGEDSWRSPAMNYESRVSQGDWGHIRSG